MAEGVYSETGGGVHVVIGSKYLSNWKKDGISSESSGPFWVIFCYNNAPFGLYREEWNGPV